MITLFLQIFIALYFKYIIATLFFTLVAVIVAQAQKTSSGDVQSGWGISITNNTAKVDTSQVMTVSRASDSIANMKITIAAKLATAAFTGAAIISALGFTPYNATNPSSYLTATTGDARYPQLSGSYSNPSWITTLAQSKVTYTGTTAQYIRGDGSLATTATNTGTVTSVATTSPITGGTITGTGTIGINNAAADNSTKGAATFDAPYFDDNGSGLISWAVASGTGTISSNAVTINQPRGKITYTSPSIIAAGTVSVTFTSSFINSTSTINVGLNGNGSNLTAVNCYIKSQTAGSCVINISNLSLLSLFNTSFVIDYFIVN